jgi:DNA-binding PucR family transcriptional regulator
LTGRRAAATPSAQEILASVRAYLAAAKHVETAAAELVVHANTVRYRIARFEELTGADLGDSRVTAEVWWALTERG